MSKPETDDGLSRFQRYRRVRRDSGMKLLRQALRFIEAAAHWPEP